MDARAHPAEHPPHLMWLLARRLLLVAALAAACAPSPPAATPPAFAGPPPPPRPASAGAPAARPPPIVQTGALVLRARAADVPPERIAAPEMQQLFATMIATMRAAPGVGLAAPQIGVQLRVIVLEDREELMSKLTPAERRERERTPFGPRVFVNPVLRPVGDEKATFFEGCLSVSGFVALVERSAEVEVSGLDERGAPQTWRVRGWPARILQHEVDHVDGTLYIDRMKTRSFTTADHARALYAGRPIADVERMLGL